MPAQSGVALLDIGCRRGDVVAVLAENRPEWLYADIGAQCVGLIGTGIYPTSSPDQIEYVLRNSGACVLFVEDDEQLDKTLAVRGRCPDLVRIVVIDWTGLREFSDPQVVAFADFLARGNELGGDCGRHFRARHRRGAADGHGVPGLHLGNHRCAERRDDLQSERDVSARQRGGAFCRLRSSITRSRSCRCATSPSAWRPCSTSSSSGVIVHFPESSGTVFNDLREVAPHMLFAPPRFWEKMHSQIDLAMRDAMPLARRIYGWALAEGEAIAQATMTGRPAGHLARWRFRLLHDPGAAERPQIPRAAEHQGRHHRRGAGPARTAEMVHGDRHQSARSLWHDRNHGLLHGDAGRSHQDRLCRSQGRGDRAVHRRGGRSAGARTACVPGLLAHDGKNRGGDRRRWLAAHRRLRRARCRRLPAHQRSAQGHHHHVGRQERHPKHHRERPQIQPLYRRRHGGWRRQEISHLPGDDRPGQRRQVRPRPAGALHGFQEPDADRRGAGPGARRNRSDQCQAGAGRADQGFPRDRGSAHGGRRGTHANHEAQAPGSGDEICPFDRQRCIETENRSTGGEDAVNHNKVLARRNERRTWASPY